ncbi:DUF2125 domain-containing protein [Daeguia caeni]|uniref:DUF2125 domain-containing protein n=1 Tax=Daeguia caeni TaxID=439612 RepID=A0ABV9H865_9HYPH
MTVSAPSIHDNGQKKPGNRWFVVLALLLIVVFLYSVVWYYMAGKLEQRAKADMAKLAAQGVGVQCEDLHIGGYPLRMNVVCDTISWKKPAAGMAFSAGRLTSGSPVYAPKALSNRLEGPAYVEFPGLKPLEINWSSFTSNTRLARPFPTEITVLASDVAVGMRTETTTTVPQGTLEQLDLSVSEVDGNLKLQGRFVGFKLASTLLGNSRSPELDGVADIDVSDAATLLSGEGSIADRLIGHSGVIHQAMISMPNGANITLSGPFSIDDDGLIDADVKLKLVNPQSFLQAGQMMFPTQSGNLTTIMFALGAMPKDENGNPIIELTIRKSKVSAGFIPLGRLPSL